MNTPPHIVVAGAGAIGCYVAGWLLSKGLDVTLLGRDRVRNDIMDHGLCVSDLDGNETRHAKPRFATTPECLDGADLVLVATKSADTAVIATLIHERAPNATVISLQNGISNADTIRGFAPDTDVRAGVVAFNVVETGPGAFHRATSGHITLEDLSGFWADALSSEPLRFEPTHDIRAVQWGKLLVNLNNALNALSGLPLLEQLQHREWRTLLADQMSETLAVLRRARIKPARFTAMPPVLVPHILRLPDPIFRRLAKQMMTIDPLARSSMQEDLRLGRKTEIAALQGEVLKLAATLGLECPVVERVTHAIVAAETASKGSPELLPSSLRE